MLKNIVEPDRPQVAIWHALGMLHTKDTNTSFEYVVFIASPRQQWLIEGASVLRYTYIVSLIYFRSQKIVLKSIIIFVHHDSLFIAG
jgi:hypothetical protein